ncbi:hypothetical protein MHK_009638 [Candidatus Magnetomorum sp. HK-1]|nr:hypothetical protein MHK_009638 [Candidatus Magnetomorum sp. HK-1]
MRACQKCLIFILILIFYVSCGGGGGDSSSPSNPQPPVEPPEKQWKSEQLNSIRSSGLIETNIRSVIDSNDLFHIVYFSSAESNEYSIYHQMWDSRTFQVAGKKTSVIKLDNCRDLATGVTIDNIPIILYQGGNPPTCGDTEQSDIMIAMFTDNQWKEYTVSIGEVERNPIVNDGVAGGSFDMIVDNQNRVHICFQFFYEGCDTMNVKYPDLWYVLLSPDTPDQIPDAVTVEGNNYNNANIQNKVGENCSIALDQAGDPMIFYQAELPDNEKGLRVAYWNNANWETEWIETDIETGHISAAWNDKDKIMGVAYYVTDNDSYGELDHCLKYAEKINDQWQTIIIDESSFCGNYCSLTYDNDGNPLIAYHAEKTRSGYDLNALKLSRKIDDLWTIETISQLYDIGNYNTIHVDYNNKVYISSFSKDKECVYIFYQ